MKTFSSSILSSKNYSNNSSITCIQESAVSSLNEVQTREESALIKILQFDEQAAQAELDSTRDFYIGLLKLANKDASTIDPAYQALFHRFEVVVAAANNIQYKVIEPSNNNHADDFISTLKRFANSSTYTDKTIEIVQASYSPVNTDNLLYPIKKFYIDGIEALKNGTFSEFAKSSKDYMNTVYSTIGKYYSKESNNIDDVINNVANSIQITTVSVPLPNIANAYDEALRKVREYTWYISVYDITNKLSELYGTMKIAYEKIDINDFRAVVSAMCDIISFYIIFLVKYNDIINQTTKKIIEINRKNIMDTIGPEALSESMSMFGDKFDKQSIFDSLDQYDFNPTEFIDLTLLGEHMCKMDAIEGRKYAIALEVYLLSEKRYDELYKVNEALGEKIKDGIKKIIETIKRIASQFVEGILGLFAPEEKYLKKYKNIILNNTLPSGTKVSFSFEGTPETMMTRLGENFKIPTASYEQLSKNPDQFTDEKKFFEQNKAGFGVRGDFKEDPNESLANNLKVYWGFKNGKDNGEQDFPKPDVIAKMYNWLLNTRKEATKLQNEVKNIERTYNNYLASSKKYDKAITPTTKDGQPTATSENNIMYSYFSAIANRIVNLNEADIIPGEKDDTTTQNTDNNEKKEEEKSDTKKTQSQTDDEVKKAGGDPEGKIARAMEIYAKTCQSVVGARATGYRAVHKEFMDIMRAIVKAKLGNKADITKDPDTANDIKNNNTEDNNAKGTGRGEEYTSTK